MIEEIFIQDLGVIAETRLKFGSGLTVLTGETGAGKTMVLTALGLLLGDRSDAGAVRQGQAQAFVEGRWWLKNPEFINVRLDEAGIGATDGELIFNRSVSSEGRSKAAVSGRSAPVSLLSELGSQLVVVHGQSDQIRLKSAAAQREALDQFAGPSLADLLSDYGHKFKSWQRETARLAELRASATSRISQAEELRLAVEELERVDPRADEDSELSDRAERLTNLEGLRLAAVAAHEALSSDGFEAEDAISRVGIARKQLEQVAGHDVELETLATELRELGSALNDVAAGISRYIDNLDSEGPQALEIIQARRAELNSLMRKYGPTLDDVISYRESAGAKLLQLDVSDEQLDDLSNQVAAQRVELLAQAESISKLRTEAARELEKLVTEELKSLAMPNSTLVVKVLPSGDLTSLGIDNVEILLSSYQGAEPRALNKGASGGELSRIMLALEVVLARNEQAPTFIFDEVDAGVGGAAAIEVGRRLSRLAKQAQVIVVTHLAQVAAFANHHLRVMKSADGAFTASSVTSLTELDRVVELARMLSGLAESESAKQHAVELLELARKDLIAS
jgi:DNA repair protein RecN (Recombination protein N)